MTQEYCLKERWAHLEQEEVPLELLLLMSTRRHINLQAILKDIQEIKEQAGELEEEDQKQLAVKNLRLFIFSSNQNSYEDIARELVVNVHDEVAKKSFDIPSMTKGATIVFYDDAFVCFDREGGLSLEKMCQLGLNPLASSKRDDEVTIGQYGVGLLSSLPRTEKEETIIESQHLGEAFRLRIRRDSFHNFNVRLEILPLSEERGDGLTVIKKSPVYKGEAKNLFLERLEEQLLFYDHGKVKDDVLVSELSYEDQATLFLPPQSECSSHEMSKMFLDDFILFHESDSFSPHGSVHFREHEGKDGEVVVLKKGIVIGRFLVPSFDPKQVVIRLDNIP